MTVTEKQLPVGPSSYLFSQGWAIVSANTVSGQTVTDRQPRRPIVSMDLAEAFVAHRAPVF
jgi:hypothetical protein